MHQNDKHDDHGVVSRKMHLEQDGYLVVLKGQKMLFGCAETTGLVVFERRPASKVDSSKKIR